MQRMTSTITAMVLAAAMFVPEGSVLQGVLRKTHGHLRGLAKESTRQVEYLIDEFDKSLEKFEDASRSAVKRVIEG